MVVGLDVTNQVVSRKRIEESELKFRLLANTAPNFVASINADDKVNFINQTFQRYTGFTLDDVNQYSIFSTLHDDDIEKAKEKWVKSLKTETEFIDEHRILRNDGVYRWHITRAIPEKDESGRIMGWIATSTDIQEIKEQELQKDYFISRASHELKTPMTSLKGYIQILQSVNQGSDDAMLLHSLSRMNLQVDKLTRLIDDLLDTTRISKERLKINKTRFNLLAMKDVIEDAKYYSDYEIEFEPHGCDVNIDGDREKISQVVTNLLTNAIKYSPDIHKVWVRTEEHGDEITISVIDRGIGINKEFQQKIFEKFYRVSGKNEETYPGFGIGLFIASEILKMHNSRLYIESEPGAGSHFYFNLKVAR